MSSIAALPALSSAPPLTGVAKLRQMLSSDAAAIAPIRRVPGEQDRRRSPELETVDDAVRGGRGAGLDETRNGRARGAGATSGQFALDNGDAPVRPGLMPLTATPSAGFITQSIHQEAMGSGLHIELWSTAIEAYRRADAGVNNPMLSQVAV